MHKAFAILMIFVLLGVGVSACGKKGTLRPPEGAEENDQLSDDLLDPLGGDA